MQRMTYKYTIYNDPKYIYSYIIATTTTTTTITTAATFKTMLCIENKFQKWISG